MSVQVTIRDVPDEVRDELASRAARAGKSMQEYLREQLERIAARPSIDEWVARVARRKALAPRKVPAAKIVSHRNADRR